MEHSKCPVYLQGKNRWHLPVNSRGTLQAGNANVHSTAAFWAEQASVAAQLHPQLPFVAGCKDAERKHMATTYREMH